MGDTTRALTLFLGLSTLMIVRAARRMPSLTYAQAAAAAAPLPGATDNKVERPLAAPWMKPLKAALNHGGSRRQKRDRSEAKRKQVQIATVDPATLQPSVRTVVFRGFMPMTLMHDADGIAPAKADEQESCALMFITDSRAEKVRHLSHPRSPSLVECCWWLDEAGVQFRISGRAVLATASSEEALLRAASAAVWERLQDSTKRTFTWPSPGEPIASATPAPDANAEPTLDEANFALVVVLPERVDELHLGGKQRRVLYTLDGFGKDVSGESRQVDAQTSGAAQLSQHAKTRWRQQVVNP